MLAQSTRLVLRWISLKRNEWRPAKTTKRISVFSPNARKYGPEKNPDSDTFHAVTALHLNWWLFTILVRLKVPIRCHSQIWLSFLNNKFFFHLSFSSNTKHITGIDFYYAHFFCWHKPNLVTNLFCFIIHKRIFFCLSWGV